MARLPLWSTAALDGVLGEERGVLSLTEGPGNIPRSRWLFDFTPYLASRHPNGLEPPSACPGAGDGVSATQAIGAENGCSPRAKSGCRQHQEEEGCWCQQETTNCPLCEPEEGNKCGLEATTCRDTWAFWGPLPE